MNDGKDDTFQKLAEYLAEALGKHYGCEFSVGQGTHANRFAIKSKEASSPFYELELSTFEQLAVSISDGVHGQGFMAVVEISQCTKQCDYGWDFDYQAVERVAVRMIDLGVELYREYEEGLNLTQRRTDDQPEKE